LKCSANACDDVWRRGASKLLSKRQRRTASHHCTCAKACKLQHVCRRILSVLGPCKKRGNSASQHITLPAAASRTPFLCCVISAKRTQRTVHSARRTAHGAQRTAHVDDFTVRASTLQSAHNRRQIRLSWRDQYNSTTTYQFDLRCLFGSP
jgi:hypothetical protein